ncbi:MAG: hypothetical protein LBQ81_14115 [Zoogloeaceae bacterium]|jgi:hypothetical protein|nr:hypothetical protein [Zoogloeaceae bacterium]
MNGVRMGDMFRQRFNAATLAAAARAQSAVPLRRAGRLTELLLVGVAACLADQPERPTCVLLGSHIGARAVSNRVVTDLIIAREAPFPYDFLATQPILAAVPLQQRFPCVANLLYQPWSDDTELHWQRMQTLARAWLLAGRCERALCGQVETTGENEHDGRWQVVEKG